MTDPDQATQTLPTGANGEQAPVVASPRQQIISQQAALNQHAEAILSNTVVGLVASLPQFVGGGPILIAASRALGALIGRMFNGDLAAVLSLRKSCRDAFNEGISKQPVTPLPAQPGKPMTAQVPHG